MGLGYRLVPVRFRYKGKPSALQESIAKANQALESRWGERQVYDAAAGRQTSVLLVEAGRSFGNRRWTVMCWVDGSIDWRPAIKRILLKEGFVEQRFF